MPSDCEQRLTVDECLVLLTGIRAYPAKPKRGFEGRDYWLDGRRVGVQAILRAAAKQQLQEASRLAPDQPKDTGPDDTTA